MQHRARGSDALEGNGPQRRLQRRLDRRLEEVAKAFGGGYCRLQMPFKLAPALRETVAGRPGRVGGGGAPPLPKHPWSGGSGSPSGMHQLCSAFPGIWPYRGAGRGGGGALRHPGFHATTLLEDQQWLEIGPPSGPDGTVLDKVVRPQCIPNNVIMGAILIHVGHPPPPFDSPAGPCWRLGATEECPRPRPAPPPPLFCYCCAAVAQLMGRRLAIDCRRLAVCGWA